MKKVVALLMVMLIIVFSVGYVEAAQTAKIFNIYKYSFTIPRNMELSYICPTNAQLSLYNNGSFSSLNISISPLDMENSADSINDAKAVLKQAAQKDVTGCDVYEYVERDQMELVLIVEKSMISEHAWRATLEIDVFTANNSVRFITKQFYNTADDSYERDKAIFQDIFDTIQYNPDAEQTTFYLPGNLLDASELFYNTLAESYLIYDRSNFGISYGKEADGRPQVTLTINSIVGSSLSIYSCNDELAAYQLEVDKDTYAALYFDDILFMVISSYTGYEDKKVSSIINYLEMSKTVDKNAYFHEKSELSYDGYSFVLQISPYSTYFTIIL